MTDIDGKNILGDEGESIDLEYLWRWSNSMGAAQEMFPSVQFQIGSLTEIPARSNGKMKDFKVRLTTNIFTTETIWNFQVNGVTQATITIPALTTGEFSVPTIVEFLKDDFLRFQMTETFAGFLFSIVEMQANLEFTSL